MRIHLRAKKALLIDECPLLIADLHLPDEKKTKK
jgi:hypothetical protein